MKSVPWHARYRTGVLKLFHDVPYKGLIWKWQFEQNPFGLPFRPVLFIDNQDRVIGFNGVMPVRATDCGRPIDASWSCDFHVAEQWRGRKLGSLIKAELHQHAEEIMAFGVSDKACQVLEHLGWERQNYVHTCRKIFARPCSLREFAFMVLQGINRIVGFGQMGLLNAKLTVSARLPARDLVDHLWASSEKGYGKVVSRSYDYLDWKYQRHPLARYAFVSAFNDERLLGLMVVRYDRGALRLVDYCGPANNSRVKLSLIRKCVSQWPHASQVTMTTSDPGLARCARACGFIRIRTKPRFFVYRGSIGSDTAESRWFLMTGDSDGELLLASSSSVRDGKVPDCLHSTGKDPLWKSTAT